MGAAALATNVGPVTGDVEGRYPEQLGASMTSKALFNKYQSELLPGIIHGFDFPFTIEQIESFGAEWLTKAFRASKAIPEDVSVTEIVNVKDITKKVGGGAADKAILTVKFSNETNTSNFFLKLPCKDVSNKLQAATANAGGPEVAFAHFFTCPYSVEHKFPMVAAKMLFCDINPDSTNFIQIQECLAFGAEYPPAEEPGAMWPAAEKFADWKIKPAADVDVMYMLLMQNAAKQAAWLHNIKDSELGKKVQKFFPLAEPLDTLSNWALRWPMYWVGRSLMFFSMNLIQNKCPQLCPAEVLDADNLVTFQREFSEALYHLPDIMHHLKTNAAKDGGLVWCHPNLNLDNAYFYRGADGKEMNVGGLDFGGYGGSWTGVVLSGSISGAEDSYYVPNHEKLIKTFCSVYSEESGQSVDGQQVFEDFELLSTFKSLVCGAVSLKVFDTMDETELRACKSQQEAPMLDDFYGRCFVSMTISSFVRWRSGNAYEVFKKFAKENKIQPGALGQLTGYIFYWPWGPLHTAFMKSQVFLYNNNLLGKTWGLGAASTIAYLGYKAAKYCGIDKRLLSLVR